MDVADIGIFSLILHCHIVLIFEANTLVGNMTNHHALGQAEALLQPHSNAMIEVPEPGWMETSLVFLRQN